MAWWVADSQLVGFQQLDLPLPAAHRFRGDSPVITATLIRRDAPRHGAAVLYVHGWNDYFFQVHEAEALQAMGLDFYALDLRRYGRSLREGMKAGYVLDLKDYDQEINLAIQQIRAEGAQTLVLMGHSTGGLITSLWAHRHPGEIDALVLNSPWLDTLMPDVVRPVLPGLLAPLARVMPTVALPAGDDTLYNRSLDEWDINPNLKSDPAFKVRIGWLHAILTAQAELARGLDIQAPVLMLTSDRSIQPDEWSEELRSVDAILDVDTLLPHAKDLGDDVTVTQISGGLHDLALSAEPARQQFFDEIHTWLTAKLSR